MPLCFHPSDLRIGVQSAPRLRIGRMEVGNKVSYDSSLHSFLGRLLRAWVHVPLYGALLLLESVTTPSLHILLLLAMVNHTTWSLFMCFGSFGVLSKISWGSQACRSKFLCCLTQSCYYWGKLFYHNLFITRDSRVTVPGRGKLW